MSTPSKKAPARTTRATGAAAGKPRAPVAVARDDDALLEPVLAAVRKRVGRSGGDDATAFAAAFYKRMGDDEVVLHEPDGWAALATDFLAFLGKRKRGTASVRLFNPTLASHGWETQHTVLQIANDDMPFLVDSVTMALADLGVGVHVLGHPVLALERDRAGRLTGVGKGSAESLMHLEIDRQSPEGCARIEAAVRAVLEDVRVIVEDWIAMRTRMEEVADGLAGGPLPVSDAERAEIQAFLRWAADNHFTFFGYREYEVVKKGRDEVLQAVEGSGLGLLRGRDVGKPRLLRTVGAQRTDRTVEPLILTKTNARSTIHRPGYMDYIGVLGFDRTGGKAVAEKRFLGLYTSSAYNRRPWDIPIVRVRHEQVMNASGLVDTGHSGKALKHILETLPRDELFQASSAELQRVASGILGLQERVRSRLFLRRDHYGRFYSVLAYVPRDRYNTEVRLRVEAMLKEALGADHVDTSVSLGESPLAQLHMLVRPRTGEAVEVDESTLQARLSAIVRNWQDDLRETLIDAHGEARGLALAAGWARALPVQYIERVTPAIAAMDVAQLDALDGADDLRLSLHRAVLDQPGEGPLRLKLYRADHDVPLSDVLPMMENMGLRVIAEHPHRVESQSSPGEAPRVAWIQDFEVEVVGGAEPDAGRFEEAFSRIWRGDAENDGFNRLVAAAGLDWRQVSMLRAYCKYMLQVGAPFSQSYVEATLVRYPELARQLVALFEARFDPRAEKGRKAAMAAANGSIRSMLDRVASLDEDRILRGYVGVIEATLRTNYYQVDAEGAPRDYIAFKFDSALVPDLPKPRPYREIFVCGPRVEGTHLRFGPVARGGLRWSDRREDFRTEVLGLVKAQMVKNTVIVPVGSKGGFIVKRPPAGGDRDALQAEGIACYRRFISGLLDLTDNLSVDGEVLPPANVVRHDDADPYMVVAADKGTASFSDIANGIAREYGYWLDDAFASGGSVGYDHKGMGITARGAWESVKRHFRALGHDTQKQDFTVVGIGDMSGDVFGNGMLLSKHIRLVAAMDHRHIFVDPDPDSAVSYRERQRLFKVPRSSWDDYDKSLISKGGGVFPRSAKSIDVSPEMRRALGLDEGVTSLSPNELMSAVLRAPVDLLWNGGIGTYVKGSTESHADVGDRANNAIRVNGGELRCRVVGEGGNLGMTQLGRIEYCRNGGASNTDFIDNAGGVSCSDQEVNIKILLNQLVANGEMGIEQRNSLLVDMTDAVAELVLHSNYKQTQAISLAQSQTAQNMLEYRRFINAMESSGKLNRQLEFLPEDDQLAERASKGQGLTRPELAVLVSYAKSDLKERLVGAPELDDAWLERELFEAFPPQLVAGHREALSNHKLRREIIITQLANDLINHMGVTFLRQMEQSTGATPGQILAAYVVARDVFKLDELFAAIEKLDLLLPAALQLELMHELVRLARGATRWFIRCRGPQLQTADEVAYFAPRIQALNDGFEQVLEGSVRELWQERYDYFIGQGVPAAIARQVAGTVHFYTMLGVIGAADATAQPVEKVAQVLFALGGDLQLPWLGEQIRALPTATQWQGLAREAYRDQLEGHLGAMTVAALQGGNCNAPAAELVADWLAGNQPMMQRWNTLLGELRSAGPSDFPMIAVATRELGELAGNAIRACVQSNAAADR